MSGRRDFPVHLYGRPYDFDACREWPYCGCLRACDADTASRLRRARRRRLLRVALGCAVPFLFAAVLVLLLWSPS